LRFVGASRYAGDVYPIWVISVLPEIEVIVIGVMAHSGMFARIKRRPTDAEIV
jgi:hypothetical protein